MAYVISISNGKGGVAKTTTSITLGCTLAEMGYRVLLVDLDHNANLTLGFGEIPERNSTFSRDLFEDSREHPIRCLKSGYKNLDLIPSNGNMVSLEGRTLSIHNSAMVLRLAIKSALPISYDYIIIDCPASLGYLTINALTASDLLIVPTQAEFFSAYALQTMFSLIRDIRQKKNPDLKYRILVTLLDLRLRDHITILNQLRKHLGDSLYKTMISVDTNFRKSHTNGVPINYLMPTTRGTLQYRELAQEVIQDLKEESLDHREQAGVREPVEIHAFDPGQVPQAVINPTAQPAHNSYQNNTLQAAPIKFPQEERLNGKGSFCTHLGKDEDPQTMLAYPSIWNKCHRAKPIASPSLSHQNIFCLSNNYSSCPMLQKTRGSLPTHLRAPMDKLELLQYFKNWIIAKIA
ncbi:MAG: ParA family protein [Anaerolineales bacterium]